VTTKTEIMIDHEVILDGQGNLTIDGGGSHRVFSVSGEEVTAELRGLTVTGGKECGIRNAGRLIVTNCSVSGNAGTGVCNRQDIWYEGGTRVENSVISGNTGWGVSNGGGGGVTLINTTVSENSSGGISNNVGSVYILNSTVSGNFGTQGGGIYNKAHNPLYSVLAQDPGPSRKSPYGATITIVNSTVSQNSAQEGGALFNTEGAWLSLVHATVSENWTAEGADIHADDYSLIRPLSTLIDGDCKFGSEGGVESSGRNIESPGDTCRFDPDGTDLVDVPDAMLGPLQDNGGSTMTHALGAGSVAIDVIPADMCEVDEDQRGEPRPGGTMCDVGAFEVQP
jgi:hypothetical protein